MKENAYHEVATQTTLLQELLNILFSILARREFLNLAITS